MTYQELYDQTYNELVGLETTTPVSTIVKILPLARVTGEVQYGRSGAVGKGRNQLEVLTGNHLPVNLLPLGFHSWLYSGE